MSVMQRVVVSGHIRQVGYRDWIKRRADDLRITGFIRPLGDGRVEILADGEAEALQTFIAASHEGPPLARVDDVTAAPVEHPAVKGFTKRFRV